MDMLPTYLMTYGRLDNTDMLQRGTTGRKLRGARDEMGNSPHPIKTWQIVMQLS